MLFTRQFKAGIRKGEITRTYRLWKRPQAKSGGRYNLAPDGVIEVDAMHSVRIGSISEGDARLAGFQCRSDLLDFLGESEDAEVTQIDFHYLGAGQVRVPDRDPLDPDDLEALQEKLKRTDARSAQAWTAAVLSLIETHPATRAANLASAMDWETPKFKSQVRKLKAMGLTISLETGYDLSPRGRQVLDARKHL